MSATRTLHATLTYVIYSQQCELERARKRATKNGKHTEGAQTVGGSIESEQ